MSFDLLFQELRPFDVSETFDGTLGQVVNIGEVTTRQGQPVTPPAVFIGQTENILDFGTNGFITEEERISALNACAAQCPSGGPICLDNCYRESFEDF